MALLKGAGIFRQILRKCWSPFVSSKAAKDLRGIHSSEEFFKILQQERSRADRNGHEFSVVIFDIEKNSRNQDRVLQLAEVLAGRLRSTDEVGWYEGRMSVFLPDTPSLGAWKLVDDLQKLFGSPEKPLGCTVYGYPLHKPPLHNPEGKSHDAEAQKNRVAKLSWR